jgi:hypothetical protein
MLKRVFPAVILTLLAATSAFAEHKLLVTEVPDPGSIEARIDLAYSKLNGKNDIGEKLSDEKTGAAVSVGAGVVKGLKLSATLPYTINQHAEGEKIDGIEDITLGARFALSKVVAGLPFDAAFGFDWKLDSASSSEGRPGTDGNIYSPSLSVSKNFHAAIPYVKYQPDFIVNDKVKGDQKVHNLTVGAEIEFGHHYSLDVAAKTIFNRHHEGLKSSTDFEFEVGPYINIVKNLYILPKVAYKIIGDIKDEEGVKELKSADEYKIALGVYYLF